MTYDLNINSNFLAFHDKQMPTSTCALIYLYMLIGMNIKKMN